MLTRLRSRPPRHRFDISVVSSIDELPEGLWDSTCGRSHPLKSAGFLRALERTFPDRRAAFVVARDGDKVAAIAWLTLISLDLSPYAGARLSGAVKQIRRVFPHLLEVSVVMAGMPSTGLQYWWFDRTLLDERAFADLIVSEAGRIFPAAHALVVRDFLTEDSADQRFMGELARLGFAPVAGMPNTRLDMRGVDLDAHYQRLGKHMRQNVRTFERRSKEAGLVVEHHARFEHLVSEMYPLYLGVFKNNGVDGEPFPPEFFARLSTDAGGSFSLLAIRAADKSLLAWAVCADGDDVSMPLLIGLDYARLKQFSLYYLVLWRSIAAAAARGAQWVDFGSTAYFIKQGFGARIQPMAMAARLQDPWANALLKPLIPKLFSVPQPEVRGPKGEGESAQI